MKTSKTNAFTLIELLVVISIIAILAGIALPVFSTVLVRGQQTKSLSNAKQIGLACRLYATDNSDIFPSYSLDPTTLQPIVTQPVTSSNAAFQQLFPDYIQNETLFFTPGSAFTILPPDNKIDNPLQATATETLKAGENTWAYVLGLTDTSNSLFPLIMDGFVPGTETSGGQYSTDKSQKGGVWEGKKAIVLRCDMSAAVEKVDPKLKSVKGNPVDVTKSIFDNSTQTTTGATWLGATNKCVNPL